MNENPSFTQFFLGILVAAALIFLWRKEHSATATAPQPNANVGGDSGDCMGCSPSAGASPDVQANMTVSSYAARGSVSPGTPPLGSSGSSARDTSFLAGSGSNVVSYPVAAQPPAGTTPSGSYSPGTAGAIAPRAVETVGNYTNLGFSHVTGTNLTNANAVGASPVPSGFPTTQLYKDVTGNVWRYNPQLKIWFKAGTNPVATPVVGTARPVTPISAPVSTPRILIGTRRVSVA
jgi:hypothetical protein